MTTDLHRLTRLAAEGDEDARRELTRAEQRRDERPTPTARWRLTICKPDLGDPPVWARDEGWRSTAWCGVDDA